MNSHTDKDREWAEWALRVTDRLDPTKSVQSSKVPANSDEAYARDLEPGGVQRWRSGS